MEMSGIVNQEFVVAVDGNANGEVPRQKRVLHFSDGTLEESDESDECDAPIEKPNQCTQVIESELHWGPWIFFKASKLGSTILTGCDYVGESLASFLGITTPKYESEIAEFKRTQDENEKRERERSEHSNWMEKEVLDKDIIAKDVSAPKHDKF